MGVPKVNVNSADRVDCHTENNELSNEAESKFTATDPKPREKWASKSEFLLSCVGLAVGISNVWRFPYIAYQNGGGAFLVAYATLLFFVGKPVFFMELAIGQFVGAGPLGVMKCFPLAKGVGIAMVVMCLLVSVYYNIIMAYTLYYLVLSFRRQVPWKECSAWWGADESCYVRRQFNQAECEGKIKNATLYEVNATEFTNFDDSSSIADQFKNGSAMFQEICLEIEGNTTWQTASEQFWERYVLQLTNGIENLGILKWDLTLTLFICWMVIFLGMVRGIKSSGKVLFITATFPYVALIALVVYGCTLNGAVDGIKYFYVPKWENLLKIQVWRAAAEQVIFSLGPGFGCLMMIGSYNDFRNKIYNDVIFISTLDFLISNMTGVVIFSVLGNLAHEMGVDIANVAKGGQGLAFVTFPEALARLPYSSCWSALFFLMMFTLAIDSQFSFLGTFLTTLFDLYPKLRPKKSVVTAVICLMLFVAGLPCVTQGGQYVFNLMDVFAGGYACLFIITAEIIAIMWGYGADKFASDVEFMLGSKPGFYWVFCWKYISPTVLSFLVIYGMIVHQPIKYGTKSYPEWAGYLGWGLMLTSVAQIPIWGFVEFCRLLKKGRPLLHPHPDWGPSNQEIRTSYLVSNQTEDFNEVCHSIRNDGVVNIAMDTVLENER